MVRLEGLAGTLATLRSLPVELVSKNGGPVRAAARKALIPMMEEAKANVRRIVADPNVGGIEGESTGLLENSITITRDSKFDFKGERMRLKVRRKAYPKSKGGKKRKSRTTVKVGALLEGGTEKMTPKPWMRPAYEKNRAGALQIFTDELNSGIDKIVKKLERQNRGKN
ncbi:MAG: hypothetical protein Q8M65_06410 [Rhodoglobus sp.]|nr:hypothetical protein [Rhodoglobus sp.]